MVLVRIATIISRVKGHHANNYKYTIDKELKCKLEATNRYSSHAIVILSKDKNIKLNGNKIKKSNKEWISVGHIPDVLAEILFPLMKTWKIFLIKAIIT